MWNWKWLACPGQEFEIRNVELEMVSLPGTGIRNSKCGIGNGLPACGRTLKSERRNAGSGKGREGEAIADFGIRIAEWRGEGGARIQDQGSKREDSGGLLLTFDGVFELEDSEIELDGRFRVTCPQFVIEDFGDNFSTSLHEGFLLCLVFDNGECLDCGGKLANLGKGVDDGKRGLGGLWAL